MGRSEPEIVAAGADGPERDPAGGESGPGRLPLGRHGSDPDAVIRSLAARQHGVVSRSQLLEAGVAAHAIDHRLARGRMDSLHRGVYRVSPAPLPREAETAAVLAYADAADLNRDSNAVVSHRSAVGMCKLLPQSSCGAPVHVSVRRGHPPSRPGLRVHRSPTLCADEVTVVEGIPVTTPARTLLDFAEESTPRELEQALAQAERLGVVRRVDLEELAARHPHRRGMRAVRALVAVGEAAFIRSEAERRFLALVRAAHLGAPATNVIVCGCEVDFLWRTERLVVEIDGFAFHSSQAAFERDRERDALLASAGFRVLRITWRQLTRQRDMVLARVAQALVQNARA